VRSTKLVARSAGYGRLVTAIEAATRDLVGRAAAAVNEALVMRNWMVGHYLVEYEQNGADRARYGARLLERLAGDLSDRGVKGLDARTLRDCRTLYAPYPQIWGPVDPELGAGVGPSFRGPLFVSRYLTALPSADRLRTLVERDRAQIEALRPRTGMGKR